MKRIIPPFLALLTLLSPQAPAQTTPTAQTAPLPAAPGPSLPQAPSPTSTQTPTPAPTPTIQARSSLVILDVVVTDKNHAPIHNLKATDFQVREGGAPQTIKSIEEHTPATAHAEPPLPPMPPGVYTNYTAVPNNGPINVLLLDRLNTPLKDQPFLHNQLIAFLQKMRPGTRLAIFGLNTQLIYLQGFTADPALLLAALESKKNAPRQSALLGSSATADSLTSSVTDAGASAEVVANVQQFEAEEQSDLTQLRVRYTLQAMNNLARYLSGIPGRKNLLWFSGSFPISILPDGDLAQPFNIVADMQDEFRDTTNLLSRSQVAVYPIDARGLQNAPMLDASQSGTKYARNPAAYGKDNAKFLAKTADEHSTMQQMAFETGGQAFVNTNGLADAAARAIDLGSSYYTITYTPTDAKYDGTFRKIQVNLERQGLDLSYRRGYYADAPDAKPQRRPLTVSAAAPPTPEHQTMHSAMLRGAPVPTQILMKVLVTPAGPPTDDEAAPANKVAPTVKGPFRKYTVSYAVSPRDVTFRVASPGHYVSSVEFVVIAYDANGAVITSLTQSVHANLDTESIKSVAQAGLQFHQIISVPAKGDYFLRAAIHDLTADHIGAVEVPIAAVKNLAVVVPEPPKPTGPTLNNLPR